MAFSVVDLVVTMAAGIFGVAIGALPSFIFVGILIFFGVAAQSLTGDTTFLGAFAFGSFGPHVGGWACGVAASAWAAKAGKLDSGRNVAAAGMGWNSPMGLLIGVIFGAIGYVVNWAFNQVGFAWTDTVALTVVVSAIIARLAFGKTGLLGNLLPAGQSRFATPPDEFKWIGYQCDNGQLGLIGLGAGIMSASLALLLPESGGVFIGFAISAVSLIFLQWSVPVPVTHHITLTAAVAAAASGSLIWGAIFGLVAAFVGEFFSRLWLVYGDTHIDPPACTIATLTSLSILLANLGVYSALVLP
jgi:hypothetical protein